MFRLTVISLLILLSTMSSWSTNHDSEVILYNTSYSVIRNSLIKKVEVVIQINNRNGEKFCKPRIYYNKKDKVGNIEAGIQNLNGEVIRTLKNKEIITANAVSDYSLYEDDFVKYFELKHNQYPYRIYYNYQITQSEFFMIADWIPSISYMVPCHKASLTLSVPSDYSINFCESNISACKIDTLESDIRYQWEADFKDPIEFEPYALSLTELMPNVKIAPVQFKFGIPGSYQSWVDFGNWIYSLKEGLDILPASEQHQIDLMVKGITDPKEKAKVLYQYLQDRTRYINVTIDIGGFKPYPASYVAENKYGDCKALTNYMKSVLKYAGIPAYYAVIYADDNPSDLIIDFPSQQFNHVILFVPFEKDSVWLECTNNICPFGYLGTFTQNREAFVIDKNNSKFIRTPAMTTADNHRSSLTTIKIDENGKSLGELHFNFKGMDFDQVNNILNKTNQKDQEDVIREFVPFSSFELVDWKIYKENRNAADISIHISSNLTNYPKIYGKDLILTGYQINMPVFNQPGQRKSPVRLSYPLSYSDTVVYRYPEKLHIVNKPKHLEVTSEFGTYSCHFTEQNNTIQLVKNLLIYPNYISLEKYPEFYQFVKEVKEKDASQAFILNKK